MRRPTLRSIDPVLRVHLTLDAATLDGRFGSFPGGGELSSRF